MSHIPVLLKEVIEGLRIAPNANCIDGTVGGGGHTAAMLKRNAPNGVVVGFDRDRTSLLYATEALEEFDGRFVAVHDSYANIAEHKTVLEQHQPFSAILLDLGMSSLQLDSSARGFSFRSEGELDMRFDQTQEMTAAELLNVSSEEHLAQVFRDYGEEPHAKRLAKAIVTQREQSPFQSVQDFTNVIERTLPFQKHRKHHPAGRLFQAVRIAVNHELDHLNQFLPHAMQLLAPGGRLAIISFHSIEDRIIKRFFLDLTTDCICPPEIPECRCEHRAQAVKITKKPIQPTEEEVEANPRARSAKLRIIEKK